MKKTNGCSGIIRLTSFFLSSFMLFQTVAVADEIIPNSMPEIHAFSAVTEPTESGNEASEAGQTDSAESNLVAEVESLRGEFEKHFINEDGSYVAVSYGYPIHYEDEDGAWQEIDNTLEEKIIGGKTKFVNKDGLFDITFEEEGEKLATIEKDGYTLSWDLTAKKDANIIAECILNNILPKPVIEKDVIQAKVANVNEISAIEINRQVLVSQTVEKYELKNEVFELNSKEPQLEIEDTTDWSSSEMLTRLIKPSSELTFQQAFNKKTSLEYIVNPTEIKENIILEDKSEITSYITTLYTGELTASLKEDKSIELVNSENEIIFTVEAPYMYDSSGIESYDFNVTLENGQAGEYFVTYLPSMAWLYATDRAYPVTIDPTISTSTLTSNIKDNSVRNGTTEVYSDDSKYLIIGNYQGGDCYSYFEHLNLPEISPTHIITKAEQTLVGTSYLTYVPNLNAYRITSPWSSGNITWSNKPSVSSTAIASGISAVKNSSGNYIYTVDITELITMEYAYDFSGLSYYHGIMVKATNSVTNSYYAICSGETTSTSLRPSISITYTVRNDADIDDGEYVIKNMFGSKYLTLPSAGKLEVANAKTGDVGQSWNIVKNADGKTYRIYCIYNNSYYYLTTPQNEYTNETELYTSTSYLGGANQKWCIIRVGSDTGQYFIAPAYFYSKAVDVYAGTIDSKYNKTVQLYEYSSTNANQKWQFIPYDAYFPHADILKINTNFNANSGYNRSNAVAYAKEYCYNYNSNYYTYYGADCTNFVSQCLYAGGMSYIGAPTTQEEATNTRKTNYTYWFYAPQFNTLTDLNGISYTWGAAENFRQHWGWSPQASNMRSYAYIQYTSVNQMEQDKNYLLRNIKPGDIIQQIEDDTSANHSMFVYEVTEDNIYYCQHSSNNPVLSDKISKNKYSVFGENGIIYRIEDKSDDFAFMIINKN